jgi:L-lysine 2,3-aminomutase
MSEFQPYIRRHLDEMPELAAVPAEVVTAMKAVSAVLPFRVNRYVIEELIDWDSVPDDPMFQLTFPQPGMLEPPDLSRMIELVRADAAPEALREAAQGIQRRLNPHPAGQLEKNVPLRRGKRVQGLQHKYRETVLVFPAAGQTCHAYCSYCFRWPQFVGDSELRFANRHPAEVRRYLEDHPEVHSVLFTGGDPMVMKTARLAGYIEPLLELPTVESIRIGTKAVAYWPSRFLDDPDADDLLRLFERVVASGRNLALMAHYSHPRELSTPSARRALGRILSTGAVVRTQAPLIRRVNDDAAVWAEMWRLQVRLGAVPYYMFIERDTGARHYFEVPLARCLSIFNDAYRQVSGLARTVRGPSMSTDPGKVLIDGVVDVGGERRFALKMIQARDPSWVGKLFFARYDPTAAWLDDLEPATGDHFFFEPESEAA